MGTELRLASLLPLGVGLPGWMREHASSFLADRGVATMKVFGLWEGAQRSHSYSYDEINKGRYIPSLGIYCWLDL